MFENYIEFIKKTRQSKRLGGPEAQLNQLENIIAMGGEVGELQNLYKKKLRDGREPTKEELISEFGDILYSLVYQIHLEGLTVEEVRDYNIEKLKRKWNVDVTEGE